MATAIAASKTLDARAKMTEQEVKSQEKERFASCITTKRSVMVYCRNKFVQFCGKVTFSWNTYFFINIFTYEISTCRCFIKFREIILCVYLDAVCLYCTVASGEWFTMDALPAVERSG